MTDTNDKSTAGKSDFSQQVGIKAARKLKARDQMTRTVWSGLGMMGLVGWSVVLPTLLGAMLGMWLDDRYPGGRSWTLALLVTGLALGCLNAWYWVAREGREISEQELDDNE